MNPSYKTPTIFGFEDDSADIHAALVDSRMRGTGSYWRTFCGIDIGDYSTAMETVIVVYETKLTCLSCAAEYAKFRLHQMGEI